MFLFKNQKPNELVNRKEYIKIKSKFQDKVPVIIKPYNQNSPELLKHKFLVNKDLNIGEFLYVIRKQFQTKQNEAVFLFFKNKLLMSHVSMLEIEQEVLSDANSDGFVYIVMSTENTFGYLLKNIY